VFFFSRYLLTGISLSLFINGSSSAVSANPNVLLFPQVLPQSSLAQATDFSVILVGLISGSHREIPSVLVRGKIEDLKTAHFQQWQVPYEALVEVLDFQSHSVGNGKVQLDASGWVTRLDLNQLSRDPELGLMLSIQEIEEKFKVDAHFDINEYAIVLSAPWLGERRRSSVRLEPQPETPLAGLAPVKPSRFNVTTVEQITTFTPDTLFPLEGNLLTIGTFLGGGWQIEIDQRNLNDTESWRLDRFQYFRPTPQTDLIIGEQTPFWIEQGQGEYWGITYLQREGGEAPSLTFSNIADPEQRLQTDRFQRDITGEAEPGTLVQLTRNRGQKILDEVLVDEDGIYRFEDVPFRGRGFQNEYDVLLFPEGQLTLDPKVRTVSFRPLPEQLPTGRVHWLVSAGGRRNNDDFFGKFSAFAGGATVRWGVAESLTLGIGALHDRGWQGWGELFFRAMNIPLDVAISGVTGQDLETRINYEPSSTFNINFSSDRVASNLRTNWQILPGIRILSRWDSQQGTELRLRGRIASGVNHSTQIEVIWDEVNQIQWQLQQHLGKLEFSHEQENNRTRTELSYQLIQDLSSNRESRLSLNYETREFNKSEQLATVSWDYRSGKRDASGEPLWYLQIGYGIGSQGQGIIADVETTILPGLRLRGRYEALTLTSDANQLSLELTTRMNLQKVVSPADRRLDALPTQGGLLVQPFFDENANGNVNPADKSTPMPKLY
jgi:hypothetical protein